MDGYRGSLAILGRFARGVLDAITKAPCVAGAAMSRPARPPLRRFGVNQHRPHAEPPRVSTPAKMPHAWRIKELAELAMAFRYC
jgi:hypothetical protein